MHFVKNSLNAYTIRRWESKNLPLFELTSIVAIATYQLACVPEKEDFNITYKFCDCDA